MPSWIHFVLVQFEVPVLIKFITKICYSKFSVSVLELIFINSLSANICFFNISYPPFPRQKNNGPFLIRGLPARFFSLWLVKNNRGVREGTQAHKMAGKQTYCTHGQEIWVK